MKKVYVVVFGDIGEGYSIEGVFETKEKANDFAKEIKYNPDYSFVDVHEFEVR